MTGSQVRPSAWPRAGSFIAATALALAFSAGPQAAPVLAVAGSIGPFYQASIVCETFNDRLIVSGYAGAAPEFNSQQIYYRIYLYQDGVGWRAISPPAAGSFFHTRAVTTRDPFLGSYVTTTTPYAVGPDNYISPGPGRYAVYIEYWWWDGVIWTGPVGTWSTSVRYAYNVASVDSSWCDLDLDL